MNQTVDSRKYYPTALALYITYFVLGVAATIMGQYKQNFAALWGAATLADGSYDVSGVVAVIAAIGLGRLIAFPVAGPLSDRLGRRLSALIGCGLYAIFLLGITFAPNLYVGYALAVVSGMANSFLDTSITPSCMEIFKEKGTIANIFTKLSISIAQFLLPFAIGFVAAHALPFRTIFIATAIIIIADGVFLAFLPFPPFEKVVKVEGQKSEKMHFTPAAIVLVCLGFTTSTTFMLWMNCNQELGTLYGLADPSKIQSFYSVGIVVALFVSAALLKRNVEPARILVIYPCVALATLAAIYFIQKPVMCLAGGFLLGFFMPLIVLFGMHQSTSPIQISNIATLGYDYLLPVSFCHNMAESGAAFGAALRMKDKELRSAALTTSFSAFLGISEPALFTVQVPNKTPLIAAMIANGIGGALTVVLGAKCYAFVMPGITSLPTYANGGALNLLMMVVCIAATFVIAAILSFILGGKLANKH